MIQLLKPYLRISASLLCIWMIISFIQLAMNESNIFTEYSFLSSKDAIISTTSSFILLWVIAFFFKKNNP